MFFFGGVILFLITQMHGLNLSRRRKLIIALPLISIMATFYIIFPEVIGLLPRVPLINYTGTIFVLILMWLLLRCGSILKRLRAGSTSVRDSS